MKKIWVAILAALFLGVQAQAAISNIYITNRTASSITIQWSSDVQSKNDSVSYASQTAGVCGTLVPVTSTTGCAFTHTYTVTGLQSNTTYCFQPFNTLCAGGTDTGGTVTGKTLAVSPTVTPTRTITLTRTPSPTRTASPTPANTGTITPTFSVSPTHTATPSITPTRTNTPVPTATFTPALTFTSFRYIQDGASFTYLGNGTGHTIGLTKQPVQILNYYFIDQTVPGIPLTTNDDLLVLPADYAAAVTSATANVVVSWDASKNFLFTDGGSGVLTTGHVYTLRVQYIYAP